jgi:hypothetical protein
MRYKTTVKIQPDMAGRKTKRKSIIAKGIAMPKLREVEIFFSASSSKGKPAYILLFSSANLW